MLEFEELGIKLSSFKEELDDLKEAIGYASLCEQVAKLEAQAAAPGFWDDLENSQAILQKTSKLKGKIEEYDRIKNLYDDTEVLIEMADEAEDLSLLEEIELSIEDFSSSLSKMRLATLLIGEYDGANAILTFHAGAGGTEA